MQFAELWDS